MGGADAPASGARTQPPRRAFAVSRSYARDLANASLVYWYPSRGPGSSLPRDYGGRTERPYAGLQIRGGTGGRFLLQTIYAAAWK